MHKKEEYALLAVISMSWLLALGFQTGYWAIALVTAIAYGYGYSLALRKGRWALSADGIAVPIAAGVYIVAIFSGAITGMFTVPDGKGPLIAWCVNLLMGWSLAWISGHALPALAIWAYSRIKESGD